MTTSRSCLRGAALACIALLIYLPALQCGFIFDDDVFLTNNELIKASDGLYKFWFSTEPPDYFPLTSSTLWLEWRLFGADPAGYHAVNVVLHAISCVMLWRLLLWLRIPGAWLAAALFAVHPVNVESVAWITQRKNTLPMVFYLAALLAYLGSEDEDSPQRRTRLYVAALAAFLLALLAKTSVVTLPLVFLACAWWRRGRVGAVDLRRTAPFFALSVILGLVTVWYQTHNAIGDHVVREDGFVSRLAIAGRAVWFYLYKALLPIELCFIYPRWETGVGGWRALVPLALLLGGLGVLWRFRAAWGRPLLFALTYYVLALLPVLGFIDIYFMRFSLVADHYQYTALIGVTALAAAGLTTLLARAELVRLRWAVAGLLLLVLGRLTWQQQAAYRDLETLWSDTLAKNPSAWVAHNNLGVVLSGLGRLEEAVAHYDEALRLDPDYVGAHYNKGDTLQLMGRFEEAVGHYEEALRHDPGFAEAHNNLGNALYEQRRFEEAVTHFQEVLRLEPTYGGARYNLANSLQELGRFGEAAAQYALALQAEPDNVYVLNRFGWFLATCPDPSVRDGGRALAMAERAVQITGEGSAVPCNTLAAAHAALGHFAEAVRWQEKAVELASPALKDECRQRLEAYRRRVRSGERPGG